MNKETRTYEITGCSKQLNILEKLFGRIEFFGSTGMSREINMYVDGDGAARLKFRKNNEKLEHKDIENYFNTDKNGNVEIYLG